MSKGPRTGDYIADWIDCRRAALAARTTESYAAILRLYIAPSIGHRRLTKLSTSDIAHMVNTIYAAGHARTAQMVLIVIRAALRAAIGRGLIDRNPAMAVAMPSLSPAPARYWRADDLRAFLAASRADRYYIAWLLALTCGLRRGEILGLRWADVDLDAAVLHIRNQRVRLDHGGVVDARPKSRTSVRDIPIPSAIMAALVAARRAAVNARLAAGTDWRGGDYVVLNADRAPCSPESLYSAHVRAINRAHVPYIPLHGMRHSCASLATACGVDVQIISDLLGHASITTTSRIYCHVIDPTRRAAMDVIAAHVV